MSPTGAAQPTVLTDRGESAPWSSAPSGETLCKGSPVRDKAAVGDETIKGALVVPLARIPDERGTIMHMLKRTDEHFLQFGEIYFTTIYRASSRAGTSTGR